MRRFAVHCPGLPSLLTEHIISEAVPALGMKPGAQLLRHFVPKGRPVRVAAELHDHPWLFVAVVRAGHITATRT